MSRQRKSYSASFKARIALAAIGGGSTANELAAKHQIHPTLISNWKKALLDGAESLFAEGAQILGDGWLGPGGLLGHATLSVALILKPIGVPPSVSSQVCRPRKKTP
jgi:transposase-like protein